VLPLAQSSFACPVMLCCCGLRGLRGTIFGRNIPQTRFRSQMVLPDTLSFCRCRSLFKKAQASMCPISSSVVQKRTSQEHVDRLPIAWDLCLCAGFTTLAIIAVRFPHTSEAGGLLRHIGAISELAGMRHWSTTHKQWQRLIVDAYALTNSQTGFRRAGSSSISTRTSARCAIGSYLSFTLQVTVISPPFNECASLTSRAPCASRTIPPVRQVLNSLGG